jgi:hypothetical protein
MRTIMRLAVLLLAAAMEPRLRTADRPAVHDDALAKDQPEVATGEDLNGPPRRFAPSKTPE